MAGKKLCIFGVSLIGLCLTVAWFLKTEDSAALAPHQISSVTELTGKGAGITHGSARDSAASQMRLLEGYAKLPLSFEANSGQTDPQVKFLSRGHGYTLFLTDFGAVISLTNRSG